MRDLDQTSGGVCPYCGGNSASTTITERYNLLVNFDGLPYSQAGNTIISGGKRYTCDDCGKDVSKFIPKPGVMQ